MAGQGDVALAKDDTTFLATYSASGTWATLATDTSQHATNWTASTNRMYSSSSHLLARVDLKSQSVLFEAATGDSGTLWCKTGTTRERVRITGGAIQLDHGGSAIISIDISSILTGSDQEFAVTVSTEPNPLTTGASDAYRTEMTVTQGTTFVDHVAIVHAALAAATGYVVGSTSTAGSSIFAGQILQVRFGLGRFVTATEHMHDWATAFTAPTLTGATFLTPPVPPVSLGIGDQGEFAGPVYAMAAAHAGQQSCRLVGPIIGECYTDPYTESSSLSHEYQAQAPDYDASTRPVYLLSTFWWWRPVPDTVNRLQVRVHLTKWYGLSSAELWVRFYSMNRPPSASGGFTIDGDVNTFDYRSVGMSTTDDHGSSSSDGQWYDLGDISPIRDALGGSYFALGLGTDANQVGQGFRINAIDVQGLVIDTGNSMPVGGESS